VDSTAVSGLMINIHMTYHPYDSEYSETDLCAPKNDIQDYSVPTQPLLEAEYQINLTVAYNDTTNLTTRTYSTIPPIFVEDLFPPEETLTEFAFNGTTPILLGAGHALEYVYLQRNDNVYWLNYTIEMRTNLTEGTWISNHKNVHTNELGGDYDIVTHDISTTNSHAYFRVKVD
jgi:hypothetical protein